MKRHSIIFFFVFGAMFFSLLIASCTKEEEPLTDTGDIKILSLTASDTVLKAWMDTAVVVVSSTGRNREFEWYCNHGTLIGSGTSVMYMAGECCVGLNTITCRVFNDSTSVSRDINIRITSYFKP
jgi:hypothetical protein